jgi:hypothetical protein
MLTMISGVRECERVKEDGKVEARGEMGSGGMKQLEAMLTMMSIGEHQSGNIWEAGGVRNFQWGSDGKIEGQRKLS